MSISADLSPRHGTYGSSVEQIACLMEPGMLCGTIAQDGDLERNASSDGKPMQIMKDINGVLLMCGYIADDSSKLVLE